MQIVDAELNELKSALHRGRTRSPETLQLIEAIESLELLGVTSILMPTGFGIG